METDELTIKNREALIEFGRRLGEVSSRLANYDPRSGEMVAGDIRAAGTELIDIAQPVLHLLKE